MRCSAGGGGGKSEGRRIKLREKNEKLNEERRVRGTREGHGTGGSVAKVESKEDPEEQNQIHPSRRARVLNG